MCIHVYTHFSHKNILRSEYCTRTTVVNKTGVVLALVDHFVLSAN